MNSNPIVPTKPHSAGRAAEIAMHALAWLFVFASPLIFRHERTLISLSDFAWGLFIPTMMFVVFYANYFLLAPRFFMRSRRRAFFIIDAALVIIAVVIIQQAFEHFMPRPVIPPEKLRHAPPHWLFVAKDAFTMAFTAAFGVATRLSRSWHMAENARREAELGRRNAELKNLRNQINPHFLLNTLNGIYALTMLDAKRAAAAIQELSRLLRYLLYDNQETTTQLSREAEFLESYVSLMRMRTAESVEISTQLSLPPYAADIRIAPLIFISLVENAFKHGVSPRGEKSHISIRLTATDDGVVDFYCRNSCFPEQGSKLSPGGIGLANTAGRLETLYPGRYHWAKGVEPDGKAYASHLVISTRELLK